MTTPETAAEGTGRISGSCGCGCGCRGVGGPWWAAAAVGAVGAVGAPVASQRGKGPAQRTDTQLKDVIEAVLTDDPWLDASAVQVSVQQGIVTLTGTAPSRAAKRRAEALAERVGDVRDVHNMLAIAGL